jgi:hypothetical protein
VLVKPFPQGKKRWHTLDPILKFTFGLFLECISEMPLIQYAVEKEISMAQLLHFDNFFNHGARARGFKL